jgi:hypothetical protein
MRQALPDIPTMCHVSKTTTDERYEVDVFSAVDVLHGKFRRAWSSALFDSAQELFFGASVGGICNRSFDSRLSCEVLFSDSDMARSGLKYRLVNYPGQEAKALLYGEPSSDRWYQAWWDAAVAAETSTNDGSKWHAESVGRLSCEMYANSVRLDPLYHLRPADMPIPDCQVLLATDSFIYIQVDFPSTTSPALANYSTHLPETFGFAFSESAYSGSVILRGPWSNSNDGPWRTVYLYDLRNLTFLYDEVHSGMRSTEEAGIRAVQNASSGQNTHSRSERAHIGQVVAVTSSPDGRLILKATGGALWSVPKSCDANVGDSLAPAYDSEGKDEIADLTQNIFCAGPTFIGTW